jgi:hypothetical protein
MSNKGLSPVVGKDVDFIALARRRRRSRKSWQGISDILFSLTLIGFAVLIWTLGKLFWDDRYYVSEEGLGYWLGITGGVLMLIAMTYAYVKRRLVRHPRVMRYWFVTHTYLGIIGPLIILVHSTFNIGSLNGGVALVSTMLVFTSGVIGRYLVTGIRRATSDVVQDRYTAILRHWRSIHVPLLYLLLVSGVIHIIAVHMY